MKLMSIFVCMRPVLGEGQWPSGRADVSEPGGPGFDPRLASRRSSLISIEHAELLRSILPRRCCAVPG